MTEIKEWGWVIDSKGERVGIADFKDCTECDFTYCGCDGDEDGVFICPNHRNHPIIDGKIVCEWKKIMERFSAIDKHVIEDYMGDGFFGDELIEMLEKVVEA